jgi:hypothetical protein
MLRDRPFLLTSRSHSILASLMLSLAICVFAFLTHLDDACAQTVTETSALNFGTAAQGAPAKLVAPGTSQNSENGSFRVQGQPNRAFTIVLPAGSIFLRASGGGVNTIEVSKFRSFPFPTSQTTSTGRRTIYIGATRSALAPNQTAGTYSGSYTIEILF